MRLTLHEQYTKYGVKLMTHPLRANSLASVFAFMINDGTVSKPDINGPTTGDCLFCQSGQHHVPHIERHIRDCVLTTSMRRLASIHYKTAVRLNAEEAHKMISNGYDPRHNRALHMYLEHMVRNERQKRKGR